MIVSIIKKLVTSDTRYYLGIIVYFLGLYQVMILAR